jgi:hypothetical protein
MVAALIPLAAALIPAAVSAFQSARQASQANQAAHTTTPAAPPPVTSAAPIVLQAPQQPMPQYALTPGGQMVQLPAQQQAALMQLAQSQQFQPQADHAALVGRAQVRHVTQQLDPQLEQIRRMLDQRSLQIQATAEHRRIEQRQRFERQVLGRLGTIERTARNSHY